MQCLEFVRVVPQMKSCPDELPELAADVSSPPYWVVSDSDVDSAKSDENAVGEPGGWTRNSTVFVQALL